MLIAALGGAAIHEPRMLQPQAVTSILLYLPLLLTVACGQLFPIASRGIDVSVGSILGLTAMSVALLLKSNPELPLFVAFGLSLAIGGLLGSVNGLLIACIRVPAIVATLGTLTAYRGLTFFLSKGDQVDSNFIPEGLTAWSQHGPIKALPWIFLMSLAVAAVVLFVSSYTRFGRNVYAIGSNPEAAVLRGIPVSRTLFWVYVVSGSCAGLAGLFYASRFGVVNPATVGAGFELPVIAATVIGGCDVRGGSGSVVGVFIGCALLATLYVGLAVLGISADWQLVAYGLVVLVALAFEGALARLGGPREAA